MSIISSVQCAQKRNLEKTARTGNQTIPISTHLHCTYQVCQKRIIIMSLCKAPFTLNTRQDERAKPDMVVICIRLELRYLSHKNFHVIQLQILSKEISTINGNSNLDKSGRKTIASIPDIFKNDSLLSSFMEFMDSSQVYTPGRSLIEFWLCASNYRQTILNYII